MFYDTLVFPLSSIECSPYTSSFLYLLKTRVKVSIIIRNVPSTVKCLLRFFDGCTRICQKDSCQTESKDTENLYQWQTTFYLNVSN